MPFFSKIYQSWSGIQNEKYEKILEFLKENNISIRGKVLDVGCGPMFFEKFIKSMRIEAEIKCIDIERQNSDDFILAKAENLPFPDSSFDMIFCLDAVHLIQNVDDIFRVLKNEGILTVSSFFNSTNQKQVETMLKEKLNKFKILNKSILKGRESEIIIIAKKEGEC